LGVAEQEDRHQPVDREAAKGLMVLVGNLAAGACADTGALGQPGWGHALQLRIGALRACSCFSLRRLSSWLMPHEASRGFTECELSAETVFGGGTAVG
jgi:hypothetical protein